MKFLVEEIRKVGYLRVFMIFFSNDHDNWPQDLVVRDNNNIQHRPVLDNYKIQNTNKNIYL